MQMRRWNEHKPNTELAAELAEACEIHPFLSLLLTSRGLDTPDQIFAFLIGLEEEVVLLTLITCLGKTKNKETYF